MFRTLLILIVLVIIVLAGLALGSRIDREEPVHVDAKVESTTTVLTDGAAPSLPDSFGQLVDGAKREPRARARTAPIHRSRAAGAIAGHACGNDLPPCYVLARESGGLITARNPHSTASGKWQVLDSTWRRFAGFARAYLAPESVQDEFARILWNHGAGCRHWSAC